MSKLAIILALAVLTASVQCVASCSVSPCSKVSPVTSSPEPPCHHKAPTDGDQKPSSVTCAPQVFVSEAGTTAIHVAFDTVVLEILSVDSQALLDTLALPATGPVHSPPPPVDLSLNTILRL